MSNKDDYTKLVNAFGISDRAPVCDAIQEIQAGENYSARHACKDDVLMILQDSDNIPEVLERVKDYFKDVD